jgi:prepilin peptidase CpaA
MLVEIAVKLGVCATLLYIIIDDLRNYRIKNYSLIFLIILFLADTLIQGSYIDAGIQFLIALTFFVILLFPYARGLLGGGDVKLLAVAFLWLGGPQRMMFAIFFFFSTLLYVVAAKCRLAPSRGSAAVYIPFGPSIAGAWLLTLLVSALR